MKVIFFVDPILDHAKPVREALTGYMCINSNTPDEMNQTFHQSGKFVMFFSDPQQAVKFLNKLHPDLVGLEYKVYSFVNKSVRFNAESQKILDRFRINVYLREESAALLKSVTEYFSGAGGDLGLDELQFNLPEEK
jgi:hypothetical protein